MNISKGVEGGLLISKRVYSLYCHILHTVFYLTRQKRLQKGGGVGTARAKIADKIYWEKPHKRVASGQSAVFYEEDTVVGSGIVSKL